MAMKTDRAQHASYALVHHVQALLLAALSIGTIMTSATILSTMAMVLPGAGAGVVGMDGAAGMAGVLTIVVVSPITLAKGIIIVCSDGGISRASHFGVVCIVTFNFVF